MQKRRNIAGDLGACPSDCGAIKVDNFPDDAWIAVATFYTPATKDHGD
jgi:hypothetical protein